MLSEASPLRSGAAVSGAPRPEPELDGWVRRYAPALRSYFARRVSEAEADDLVQEVFLRLHASRRDAPIENPERFLFTVARNILISRHRYNNARRSASHEPLSDSSDPIDTLSPERIVIGADEYERIVQAILALPPRARAAFQFHRFEGLTYQQIAMRMGISHQSVKELIQRALVRLAEAMEDRA